MGVGGARVALHLRGHELNGLEIWDRAERLAPVAAATGAWLVVNDRIDVAVGCGAQAVQLGRESIPAELARRVIGDGVQIGVSVHDPAEAAAAVRGGADFLLAGTLFRSATHPAAEPVGTRWLAELVALGVPVIGIGGIDATRVREVIAAGAYGVAVVRAVWAAPEPERAAREILQQLE